MYKRQAWDRTTIDNVTHYIANSNNVAKRVKKFYNRESNVVYPPIASSLFNKPLNYNTKRDFFLSFGAITPYKRIDLLVDTFNKNGLNLIIIGDGSERQKLAKVAKSNVQFLGSLVWDKIEYYLHRSRALLFPGEEDFGMIPLEVMSYGIPVLAYGKGGALETVVENKEISKSSGLFFKEQSIASIQNCLQRFLLIEKQYDKEWIRAHAKKFGEDIFLKKFKDEVEEVLKNTTNN